MRLMQRIVKAQNRTLVMVTHDNHLAEFADRIFHISDGKIVQIEETENRTETGDQTEARKQEETGNQTETGKQEEKENQNEGGKRDETA